MLVVPDTHPSVEEHLAVGGFVVQQQNQYSFSQTSVDQTIEQTINRDSNTNAVHCWILLFNQCAEISRKAEGCHKKKDFTKS